MTIQAAILRPFLKKMMIKKARKDIESQQNYIKSLTNKAFLTQLGQE
jgi:hypothetical protein